MQSDLYFAELKCNNRLLTKQLVVHSRESVVNLVLIVFEFYMNTVFNYRVDYVHGQR